MKMCNLLIVTLSLAMLVGCQREVHRHSEDRDAMNAWIVRTYQDDMVRNAVIAEHTLYSHHFLNNSVELNEMGRRDLEILAEHLAQNPGQLNLHRGGGDKKLHQQRTKHLAEALADAGVDSKRVKIQDGFAGGDGAASIRVIMALEAEKKGS